jgi:hypothetical protein
MKSSPVEKREANEAALVVRDDRDPAPQEGLLG